MRNNRIRTVDFLTQRGQIELPCGSGLPHFRHFRSGSSRISVFLPARAIFIFCAIVAYLAACSIEKRARYTFSPLSTAFASRIPTPLMAFTLKSWNASARISLHTVPSCKKRRFRSVTMQYPSINSSFSFRSQGIANNICSAAYRSETRSAAQAGNGKNSVIIQ